MDALESVPKGPLQTSFAVTPDGGQEGHDASKSNGSVSACKYNLVYGTLRIDQE
jgi:hypothetical protein